VNDIFGGQIEPLGDDRFARLYRSELIAGCSQTSSARRSEYGAAYAAAHRQICIGGVDDSVCLQLCYVVSDNIERHNSHLLYLNPHDIIQIDVYCQLNSTC
jgi:hypothetical protein